MTIYNQKALEGMTYLVTGASSGIGRATAVLLSACGAKLILSGRDTARLEQTLGALSGDGHLSFPTELQDADKTAEWAKGVVGEVGPLTGVFHAAGMEMIRPVRMVKQAQLNNVFGSSLFAGFGLARAIAGRNFLVDGGSVVYMSSVAGSTGEQGMTAYSAAKAGIDGLVRSLACELAPRRIRVNSIAAGAVQTAMHDRWARGSGDDAVQAYAQSHLLGFGVAEDVANAAVYLLSPASRWVTGTTMAVDGGYMVR